MKVVVRADERCCEVESAPDAERFVCEQARRFTELEADLGRAFAEIDRKRSYLTHGARSLQAWAMARGYGPRQVRQLLELGRALAASPRLERRVRAGRVTTESAAEVGRLFADEAVREGGVDEVEWIRKAEALPPRALRHEVLAAIEQANQKAVTVPIRLQVTHEARDNFQRARRLASRGRRKLVSEGTAFAIVVDDYLDRHDPRRRPLPARRGGAVVRASDGGGVPGRAGVGGGCPDGSAVGGPDGAGWSDSGPGGTAAGRGRDRRIAARVRAEVERRSGGTCEICRERRAVEKMHLRVPHARGGSRELDNLADACHQCHLLADAGYYTFSHFDAEHRPVWEAHPDRLGAVRERAPPYRVIGVSVTANGRNPREPRFPRGSASSSRARGP